MISFDEFAKVEIKVGLVTKAENVNKSDRLIRLHVDMGEETERVIFTAVRTFGFTPEDFEGKKWLFVANLEPKPMMGEESQGMILAVDDKDSGKPIFVSGEGMSVGSKVH